MVYKNYFLILQNEMSLKGLHFQRHPLKMTPMSCVLKAITLFPAMNDFINSQIFMIFIFHHVLHCIHSSILKNQDSVLKQIADIYLNEKRHHLVWTFLLIFPYPSSIPHILFSLFHRHETSISWTSSFVKWLIYEIKFTYALGVQNINTIILIFFPEL